MGSAAPARRERVQASCVALGLQAVLIRGAPGSGKSDLALRLIDGGARLVADDLVELRRSERRLVAAWPADAPRSLAGHMEVRGLGIVRVPHRASAGLALIVDLAPGEPVERLPEPRSVTLLGLPVPLLVLDPFTASAVAKVRLAVRTLPRSIIPAP
jgi:serine kinase of HPr protein (carbohydrate metabolism regulator)